MQRSTVRGAVAEATDTGKSKLLVVAQKLEGRTSADGLPMSVEGQVLWLIQQATDINNLSKMYHGWLPWL